MFNSYNNAEDTNTTYKLSKSGAKITLTGSDGTTTEVTDDNTTYNNATTTAPGLMSAEDKTKLNSLNNYSLPEAGAALGGVKSGGDVAIANGVITVNDNSHAHTIANISGLQGALNNKLETSKVGAANGVASLGADGKVPGSQLPSYVDDVIEGYYSGGKFYKESTHGTAITGESGKIYVDLHTNKSFRWSGSAFTEISASIVVGTTSGTALDGKTGTDHINNKNNPHGVTKATVGLGNVENKSSATIRGELTKENVTTALGYTPPTTNTTYGVATGSALGLVKSGTDITVDSSGNVSVNDDSHNHVIGNVDGLQNELNTKATNAALNSHTGNATVHVTSSEKNTWNSKAAGDHNHDNRYYTETEVNNLLKNKSDISHTHDRGTNSIEEKSTTGIRFSKIGEITCTNKYQRVNQQFIFNTRDESALVTIEFQSTNNTLFSGQSISYMPLTSSVNFINNLRAGFNLVGTNANRFEMWYRQDQWGASLNIVPIGVNRENYHHITWYNVNATAANSATEPSFSTKINFTRLLDWSFITGKPTSLPANGGTAAALSTNAGGATQPVYFTGGKPTACTYTLGKSVPSNAVFTDTTYSAGKMLQLSGTQFRLLDTCASIADWNTATTTGWYMSSNAANAPTAGFMWYFGQVIAHNTMYVIQEVYQFTANSDATKIPKYIRAQVNKVWGPWTDVTVQTKVPSNAKFTDTVYTHPSSHSASMITQDTTHRFVTDTQVSSWNSKASTAVATTSANGLMSSGDKGKLDGIAVGANKTVVDSSLSGTSTNPVQNKIVTNELSKKINLNIQDTKPTSNGIWFNTANTGGNTTAANSLASKVLADAKVYSDSADAKIKSELNASISSAKTELSNSIYTTKSELKELNTTIAQIWSTIYPIGSVYISVNSTNPGTLFGGTWERIAQGRTLFGEGALNGITYNGGQLIEAGLPNIEGKWTAKWNQPLRGFHGLTVEGAFYDSYPDNFNGPGRFFAEDSGANTGTKGYPWFDASRSNPIYGKSTTVQPNAIVVYIWKRTA